MKKDIHPENYRLVVFKDTSSDTSFLMGSTIETEETIKWEDGNVIPSSDPGLGVVLNEDVARANPYSENDLHLMPEIKPQPFKEGL